MLKYEYIYINVGRNSTLRNWSPAILTEYRQIANLTEFFTFFLTRGNAYPKHSYHRENFYTQKVWLLILEQN